LFPVAEYTSTSTSALDALALITVATTLAVPLGDTAVGDTLALVV
jgi:hypothetical protein